MNCIPRSPRRRCRAWMNADLILAMTVLVLVIFPLAGGLVGQGRLMDAELRRAALVELLDGEMEVLLAGAWRQAPEGESPVTLTGAAVRDLPPGRCVLHRVGRSLRLEWRPDKHPDAVSVLREGVVP